MMKHSCKLAQKLNKNVDNITLTILIDNNTTLKISGAIIQSNLSKQDVRIH